MLFEEGCRLCPNVILKEIDITDGQINRLTGRPTLRIIE